MSDLNRLLNSVVERVNSSVRTTAQSLTTEQKTQARENIGAVEDDVKLPSYYDDYLPSRIEAVKTLMDEAGADGTAFIMFSDSHMELAGFAKNGGNSGKLAYHVADSCSLPYVLYLGDANSNSPQETEALCIESLEAFNAMVKPLDGKIVQALGNHDGAWGLPVDDVTYPYNISREKRFNRVLQKNRLGIAKTFGDDGTYFYLDDFGSKTRLIMLNTIDKPYETNQNGTMTEAGNTMKGCMIRQAQVDWLISALNIDDGWHVIVAAHHPLHDSFLASAAYIRGLLAAYRDKTTYTASYAGEFGESGSGGYTNLYDATAEGYSLSGTTLITNYIYAPLGSTIHIKSTNNIKPYKIHGYDSTKTKLNTVYIDSSTDIAAADYDSTVYTVTSGSQNTSGDLLDYPTWTYITLEFRNVVPTDLVITVDENIEGEPAGGASDSNMDALSINADFTGYKGDFIAYFCGHVHNDYHYPAATYGIDMISVACDGRVSNNSYMTDENYANRELGTVYEQVLDAVVINKAESVIKTVRIGAGADREITY